ncbi:gliding motility protein GldN [Mucilaginibacter sp. UR6-11]|uniref:type IX secretion system ring protein PorN/GldN n=1 Tax=Mucilaginibacter sp. UR6-11 TaxID=1435644 RepID=UPI001E4FF6CE|nr:gliding motility protein GldN [Mucilaginibacter sp. UR6-11]MCC8425132.1 gliding motility protein GldN [Mucilaginibacter sp. UR6-11]
MKTRFLIVVLCLACVASFAQSKKKKAAARKPAATQGSAAPSNPVTSNKQSSTVDTSKKITDAPITADPSKPFDRPLDGYYKKSNIQNNKVTPYANVRESDVVFAKRVWEEIDLREKVNMYLGSPKSRLIDVLMDAIAAGELTAYDPIPTKNDPNGDGFATPLSPAKARAKMADSALVNIINANGEKTGSKMVAGDFQPDSIVKFRIKEDWLFDKQRSVWEPRIIGIAPMIKQKVEGANLALDYQPAFWIYFPAARQVLVTKEAFNRNNDATDLSFDDVFLKRLFHGYVVKVSNDKDERIKDYAIGIDRLYESERIKKSLMDWELNLWQY